MTLEDHCKLQYWTAFKLQEKGYLRIYQNMEYQVKINGRVYAGEVDILAQSPSGKWHFYEIKSCSKKKAYAREQYERFKLAHPFIDLRGVFVSPNKINFL